MRLNGIQLNEAIPAQPLVVLWVGYGRLRPSAAHELHFANFFNCLRSSCLPPLSSLISLMNAAVSANKEEANGKLKVSF